MRKHFYFIIPSFVFVFFLWSCNNIKRQNNPSTVIRGNIQFPVNEKIYFFSYADSLNYFVEKKTAIDSSLIDKNGNYEFSLGIKKPTVFSLRNGNRELVSNLLICQNDEQVINFIGKEITPEIKPEGESNKFNKYILSFLDTFYKNPATGHDYYIVSNYLDIHQYKSFNENRKKRELDFFQKYFNGDSLKKELKDYALYTIQYENADDRLLYLWKKRMKGEPVSIDSSYFDFATPSFIENEDAFITPSYIRFLNFYLKDTFERMVQDGQFKNKTFIPAVEKYKLAHTQFREPFLDVVLFNIIYNDLNVATVKKNSSRPLTFYIDSLNTIFRKKYSLH